MGRRSAENITRTKGGPTAASRNVENPVDSLELFFTDEILQMIIYSTNRKIDTFREEYNDELEQNDKNTNCRNIDLIEFKAFFGIMYLRGTKHLNLSSTHDLFYTKVHWIYSVLQCNTSDVHSYGDFWILMIKKRELKDGSTINMYVYGKCLKL